MAFVSRLDAETILTEHVVDDAERLQREGSRNRAVAPYAIRVVWTVDVQYDQVVVTASHWAKTQGGGPSGGGAQSRRDDVARAKVPDEHITTVLRRVSIDDGPGYDDITLVFPGSGAPEVNGRDAYEEVSA